MVSRSVNSWWHRRDYVFVTVAVALFAWAIPTFFVAAQFTSWDFVAFWGAGKALNLGLDPYLTSTFQRLEVTSPFFSPIFVAELCRPIAALIPSAMQAKLVWTAVNIIGGAALSALLLRLSGLRVTATSFTIAAALLVAFEPFTSVLELGQTDVVVVLAIAVSWLLLEQRRYFLAGLIFCCGASNPHLILGIGVYYLYRAVFRHESRLLLGMIVGGVLFVAINALYLDYSIEWVTQILPAAQARAPMIPNQITLLHLGWVYGIVAGLSSGHAVEIGGLVTASITALTLVASIMIWRRNHGRSIAIEMSAAVALTVMATTWAFHQDLLLLTLLAPSVLAVWRDTRSIKRVGHLIIFASTFLFSALPGLIFYSMREDRLLLYFVAPFLAGVLLLRSLSPNQMLMRRVAPLIVTLAALSLLGDFLPWLVGFAVVQFEITLILMGVLAYLFAIWRWYGSPFAPDEGRTETGGARFEQTPALWGAMARR